MLEIIFNENKFIWQLRWQINNISILSHVTIDTDFLSNDLLLSTPISCLNWHHVISITASS